MLDLIWDVFQQAKIERNEKEARHALSKASIAHAEVASVDQKLDRLTLITAALWEIIQERHGVTEVDLAKKMLEIDLRDGVQDGKMGYEPTKCKSCGKVISTKDMACIYCGSDSERKAKLIFR